MQKTSIWQRIANGFAYLRQGNGAGLLARWGYHRREIQKNPAATEKPSAIQQRLGNRRLT